MPTRAQVADTLRQIHAGCPHDCARWVREIAGNIAKQGESEPTEKAVTEALHALADNGLVSLTQDGWRHEWSGPGFLAGMDGVGR